MPVYFVLFDLLYLEGRNLMPQPYAERPAGGTLRAPAYKGEHFDRDPTAAVRET